jgi:glycine/D-amino acid oxidase-like deaminating enzyme
MHNHYGALSYGAEILDRDELAKMMPGLGPDVVGGSYCPHDGHTNPLKLLRALHAGMAAQGARYVADAQVEAVARDGDGFVAKTAKGTYRGAQIVLAAGHGNTWLAPSLGLDVPLIPEKGQILVTERATPLMPMPTHLLRQTAEGTIMIGDSHEDTGYSTDSSTPVIAQIAHNAQRCFPALGQLRVVRSWGAVRILSPDGFPIYQESESHRGAYSINCHSGVTLAAAHALKLAPVLAQGQLSPDFDVFHSRRFADGTTQNSAH